MEMEIIDNPAYGNITKDTQPSGDDLYDLVNHSGSHGKNNRGVDHSASHRNNNGGIDHSASHGNNNGVATHKTCNLVVVIAFSTAVLALMVAVVFVGLSIALNSNSEIQSLAAEMKKLQVSLNQSVNSMEDLGQQISAVQTNTTSKYDFLDQKLNCVKDIVREHTDFLNKVYPKGSITNPATSCSEIPTDSPSGDYWIVGNPSPVQVYCDMNRTCCNTTGGWMKVANLDMTDSNQQCPDGFLLHNANTAPLRTCGRPGPPGCVSTTFPVHGIEYSRVCGRVIGYQFATTDAFNAYFNNRALTINDDYVDGVSLTHGQSPRKHIWTFAVAIDEVDTRSRISCPCTRSDRTYTGAVPPFIGQDYFCDTGSRNNHQFIFYSDDPLWNGEGCGGTSTCCSFNNPPWFCKQLPQPTTDDVELRLCCDQAIRDENTFLELVDIFVQ